MEYVEGKTLDDIITEQGALDVDLALDYAVQIGQAVDHAHRQGVVHRDLRPPNVLVSANGTLKVADFGTSRLCVGSLLCRRNYVSDAHWYVAIRSTGSR